MRAHDSSRAGGLIAKSILLLGVGAVALVGLFTVTGAMRKSQQCKGRLEQIHRALELYEIERGTLPSLAFYPDDPREGLDSLRGALEHYGVDDETCICPGEARTVREAGQTFLWNAALSGRKMPRGETPVWMLVEISALSADVPSPHWGGYHALFTDGSIRTIRDPARELPGL